MAKRKTPENTPENIQEKGREKKAYIYLGPNIPGGLLHKGGVYKEIPEHLGHVFAMVPDVERLFIDVREAAAYKEEQNQKGSEAHRFYQNTEALIADAFRRKE